MIVQSSSQHPRPRSSTRSPTALGLPMHAVRVEVRAHGRRVFGGKGGCQGNALAIALRRGPPRAPWAARPRLR